MEYTYLETEEHSRIGLGASAARYRSLVTSIPPVDALLRGLEPGTITFIDSSDRLVFELVNLFCFNAVNELHEEVLWIDGGNSVNPYELSAICKRYRVPPEEVLHNITVSRAFTAYQMSTLIEDMLDPEVDRIRTGLVVVSCFPDLFQDADMNWTESLQLMRRAMEKLRALTEERSLITIITNYGQAKPMSRKGLTLPAVRQRGPRGPHRRQGGVGAHHPAQGGGGHAVPAGGAQPDHPGRVPGLIRPSWSGVATI